MSERIEFVDVTLRDGHQSLWAERMTTGMMLPMVERLDRAGFIGLEVLSPSFIGKCVRDLHEDPIERIRLLAKRGGRTPMRVNGGGLNLFGSGQQSMVDLFWRVMAEDMTEDQVCVPALLLLPPHCHSFPRLLQVRNVFYFATNYHTLAGNDDRRVNIVFERRSDRNMLPRASTCR